MNIRSFRKKPEPNDDKLMTEIIKNVIQTKNNTYSDKKLKGLCRVSFNSTHKRPFTGNLDKLWQEATVKR